MNKARIKAIHSDIDNAIKSVGEKHNFKMNNGSRITYDDTGFAFKVEVLFTADENGQAVDPDKEVFERDCWTAKLSPSDYLREVHLHGDPRDVYLIVGVKPKAKKNSVIIKNKRTDVDYVCSPYLLRDLDDNPIVEHSHVCKYCGEYVPGTDEDLLCKECRQLFGHAFFSEL